MNLSELVGPEDDPEVRIYGMEFELHALTKQMAAECRKGYARDDLIAICEQASVPQDKWLDRDSAGAQRQVGECFALLKAGCEFTVSDRAGATSSPNPGTLWVRITYKGFDYFEYGEVSEDIFYLPTPDRIESAAGGDWY